MKIKTYTVATLSEAVERIKEELGPQAVILSTRKMEGGHRWWLKERPKLEVTAAVDAEGRAPLPPPTEPAPRPGEGMRYFQRIAEEQIKPVHEELRAIRDFLSRLNEERPSHAKAAETNGRPATDTLATTGAPAATAVAATTDATEQRPTLSLAPELQHAVMEVCRTLLWHRIEAPIVEALADYCIETAGTLRPEIVRERAAHWLMEQLPEVAPVTAGGGDRIITLVGPTGSGKTTTLVKLASQFVLEQKRSVAFITLDHYRIGAEEQLRKYAGILQVPCELATDTLQLRQCVERHANVDLLLIDTTGRSPNDTEGMRKIEQSLSGIGPAWRALVLPVTLQGPDLQHAMAQFTALRYNRFLITKLDEAVSFGTLFNASAAGRHPLAYFTMGQQVPEDIETASRERVMDCLLNFSGMFPGPRSSTVGATVERGSVREEGWQ